MSFLSKLFGSSSSETTATESKIAWRFLDEIETLTDIKEKSFEKPQVIFKHSTRCGISRMALRQFESEMQESVHADFWLLDLLNQRSISNQIAQDFKVEHQSPQVLLIKNAKVVYTESHYAISAKLILSNI